jgi:hypothetical protein
LTAEKKFGGLNKHGTVKTSEEFDYQFDIFFFLPVGYLFEILVLPSSEKVLVQ